MSDRSENLTYEDIAAAIEALKEQNQKPTDRRIRDFLGRGSLTTISRQKRQYLQSDRYLEQFRATELSESFIGAAVSEIKRILDIRMKKTNSQLETAYEDLENANKRLDESFDEIQRLEDQISCLNETITGHEKGKETMTLKIQAKLELEVERANTLKNDLNKLREELADSKSKISINEHKINQNEEIKKRLEKSEEINYELTAEVKQLNQELRDLLKEKSTLEKGLALKNTNSPSKQKTKT